MIRNEIREKNIFTGKGDVPFTCKERPTYTRDASPNLLKEDLWRK